MKYLHLYLLVACEAADGESVERDKLNSPDVLIINTMCDDNNQATIELPQSAMILNVVTCVTDGERFVCQSGHWVEVEEGIKVEFCESATVFYL